MSYKLFLKQIKLQFIKLILFNLLPTIRIISILEDNIKMKPICQQIIKIVLLPEMIVLPKSRQYQRNIKKTIRTD